MKKNIYQKMYYHLFNCVTDALKEMEEENYAGACSILRRGQIRAEEMFLAEAPAELPDSALPEIEIV